MGNLRRNAQTPPVDMHTKVLSCVRPAAKSSRDCGLLCPPPAILRCHGIIG